MAIHGVLSPVIPLPVMPTEMQDFGTHPSKLFHTLQALTRAPAPLLLSSAAPELL